MQFTVGSWVFPLVASVLLLVFLAIQDKRSKTSYGDYGIGSAIAGMFRLGIGIIICLIFWIIWLIYVAFFS